MSHEITFVNGQNSIAYVGATPWHGLGQRLDPAADMDTWLKAAGMDYRVQRSRVRFATAQGQDDSAMATWDDRHVLFRSDTKLPLGLVSDGFKIVQPRRVLEFFRDLCSEHGFQLETAGTLYEGARYWALAKMPLGFKLRGTDQVNAYALLATAADGSLATTGQVTSVRVVCNNTLSLSLADSSKPAIKVRHSTHFDETKMKVDLGLIEQQWQGFGAAADRLASRKLSRGEAVTVLINALGDPLKPVEDQPNARPMAEILQLFSGRAVGAKLEAADGTAWGLVNAATQYYDHSAGRSPNTRLASAWFGPAAQAKNAVFKQALAVAA